MKQGEQHEECRIELEILRQKLEAANWRVDALEKENDLLKQKLLDIEAYFQSGRR